MQVDGGVGVKNIREIAEAGADMFVVRPSSSPPLALYRTCHQPVSTALRTCPSTVFACLSPSHELFCVPSSPRRVNQAGSAIFKNPRTKDAYAATINEMRAELAKVSTNPLTRTCLSITRQRNGRVLPRAKWTKEVLCSHSSVECVG